MRTTPTGGGVPMTVTVLGGWEAEVVVLDWTAVVGAETSASVAATSTMAEASGSLGPPVSFNTSVGAGGVVATVVTAPGDACVTVVLAVALWYDVRPALNPGSARTACP